MDDDVKVETAPKAAQFEDLLALLDTLVPPEESRIVDCFGHEYYLPAAISTRRQVALLRVVRGAIADEGLLQALSGGASGLLRVLASDTVLDTLEGMVTAAVPELLQAARGQCGQPEAQAVDLFAAEEILATMLPFCGRASRRLQGLRQAR